MWGTDVKEFGADIVSKTSIYVYCTKKKNKWLDIYFTRLHGYEKTDSETWKMYLYAKYNKFTLWRCKWSSRRNSIAIIIYNSIHLKQLKVNNKKVTSDWFIFNFKLFFLIYSY